MTGIRQMPPTRRAAGALFEWAYFQFGVPGVLDARVGRHSRRRPPARPAGEAARPDEAGRRRADAGRRRTRRRSAGRGADDGDGRCSLARRREADGFVAWTPFKHPTLGAVEIGGFRPFAHRAAAGGGRGARQDARRVPRPALDVRAAGRDCLADGDGLGGGLYRIKAEIENRGRWPTALQHASPRAR